MTVARLKIGLESSHSVRHRHAANEYTLRGRTGEPYATLHVVRSKYGTVEAMVWGDPRGITGLWFTHEGVVHMRRYERALSARSAVAMALRFAREVAS